VVETAGVRRVPPAGVVALEHGQAGGGRGGPPEPPRAIGVNRPCLYDLTIFREQQDFTAITQVIRRESYPIPLNPCYPRNPWLTSSPAFNFPRTWITGECLPKDQTTQIVDAN
jgi:hypothetical protein